MSDPSTTRSANQEVEDQLDAQTAGAMGGDDIGQTENPTYQFTGLLQLVNDLVWAISLNGRKLMYINPAAGKIYNRSLDELRENQLLWFKCIHRQDRRPVLEQFKRLQTASPQPIEFRVVRPNGDVRWISSHS